MGSCILHHLCNLSLASNIYWLLLGTYMSGTDPRFDPFCVWGNEIFMNKRQVRKLRKIVRRKKRLLELSSLFTLCQRQQWTLGRWVMCCLFPLPTSSYSIRLWYLIFFVFSGFQSFLLMITLQATWSEWRQLRLKYIIHATMIML